MSAPRVLVAEDDHFLAALVRQTLEIDGLVVEMAENGKEALRTADIFMPDIIVLDAMMPIMDGYETLRMLKNSKTLKSVPVLMLTAKRSEADVKRAIASGASDYLTKPFRPDYLVKRVRRLLDAKLGQPSKAEPAPSFDIDSV